jgi:hypothetical protein
MKSRYSLWQFAEPEAILRQAVYGGQCCDTVQECIGGGGSSTPERNDHTQTRRLKCDWFR